MIPVMMFPILRKYNEGLALGYVVFRGALEAASYVILAIGWLMLLPLSQTYVEAGAPATSEFRDWANLLLNADEVGSILTTIFRLGALMFYYLLYRSELVPRWLSGWGLIGLVPYLASGLLAMFTVAESLSTILVVLQLPVALQEMVLAVWLIVKGFDSSTIASETAKSAANQGLNVV